MKKRALVFLFIGLILVILPFCFNLYSLFRLLSLAVGIILITLSLAFSKFKNTFLIILLPIILIFFSYAVDTFLFYKFNRIPIFVYEIKSSSKVSTYNSFFYRIYNCNQELVLDYAYQKKYVCSDAALTTIDINDFLKNPNETYKEYKNKFVKLSGKISKINGNENIELGSYIIEEDSLNGYVNFNNNYAVEVSVSQDLSNFRIYDDLSVIGLVSKYEESDGKYYIYLEDVMLLPSESYESYIEEIKFNNSKDLISLVSEENYYLYGISSFNIRYSNNTLYELSYLITDSRITLDDLISDTSAINLNDENENLIAKKYELDNYNLLVCENSKKIIANKDFELNTELCEH